LKLFKKVRFSKVPYSLR